MEPMAKLTSSPTGLPMWGRYWQPIMGCQSGAHTKPKGLIRRLPIWGGHGARGQMDIELIWAAHMGPTKLPTWAQMGGLGHAG